MHIYACLSDLYKTCVLFLSLSTYCKVRYCMYVGVGKIETTFVPPAVNAPSGKIRQVCTNAQRFTNRQKLFFSCIRHLSKFSVLAMHTCIFAFYVDSIVTSGRDRCQVRSVSHSIRPSHLCATKVINWKTENWQCFSEDYRRKWYLQPRFLAFTSFMQMQKKHL